MQLPVFWSHASLVQPLLSSQLGAAPGVHRPSLHKSPTVHGLPSLHGAVFSTNLQPALASQLSSLQGLPSLQFCAVPARQMPPLHASPLVHTEPSASHGLSSLMGAKAQLPSLGSQWFSTQVVLPLPSHATTVLGLTLHLNGAALLSQNSVPLHRLPSSWLAQSLSWLQPQVLVPPWHAPFLHWSPVVHGLPSSHRALLQSL